MPIKKAVINFNEEGDYTCHNCGVSGKKEDLQTKIEYNTKLSMEENLKNKPLKFHCPSCNTFLVEIKVIAATTHKGVQN